MHSSQWRIWERWQCFVWDKDKIRSWDVEPVEAQQIVQWPSEWRPKRRCGIFGRSLTIKEICGVVGRSYHWKTSRSRDDCLLYRAWDEELTIQYFGGYVTTAAFPWCRGWKENVCVCYRHIIGAGLKHPGEGCKPLDILVFLTNKIRIGLTNRLSLSFLLFVVLNWLVHLLDVTGCAYVCCCIVLK